MFHQAMGNLILIGNLIQIEMFHQAMVMPAPASR